MALMPTSLPELNSLSSLSLNEKRELLQRVREQRLSIERGRRFYSLYPETGPLSRFAYPKHMAFFAAGAQHHERAAMGGNRTGKTNAVAFEAVAHLTGEYPAWWIGRRFSAPVVSWIAGESVRALRDSLQVSLLGEASDIGTGMVPRDLLVGRPTARTGTADAYDTFLVRHKSGGTSRATFKSYDQGREAFQAAKVDVVVLDEEPPQPIYSEALMRTMATQPGEPNGIVMCAFTPLKGLSAVVLSYMPHMHILAAA